MKKIRIGNNIKVSWTLRTASGEPFEVSGYSHRMWASTRNHKFPIEDYSVEDNILTWEFKGEDQKWPGPYTITFEAFGDNDRKITIDLCEAFELVEWSCLAGGADGEDLTIGALEFSSDVLVGFPGPPGPRGLSAYEVAVAAGFKGTEAEWLESLRPECDIDNRLDPESSNAIANSAVTAEIGKIYDELYPVKLSVSGGGVYKKGTSHNVILSWKLTESGSTVALKHEDVTIDGVPVSADELASGKKTFSNVSSTTTYTVRVNYRSPYTGIVSSYTGSVTVTFVDPGYFGAIGSDFEVTESSLIGLTELVRNGRSYAGTVNLEAQRVLYAYPAVFGLLTSIKDANNFEYIGSYEHSQMTLFNVLYNIYILKDAVSAAGFSQTYK